MNKTIITFLLIFIGTTGCKAANTLIDAPTEKKADAPVAVHDDIPEGLPLPTYPETPLSIQVSEYADGWRMEQLVPNALAIAKPAWINKFTDNGWSVTDDINFENQNKKWIQIQRDNKTIFIQFEETKLEREAQTEDEADAEPILKGETKIITYVKK